MTLRSEARLEDESAPTLGRRAGRRHTDGLATLYDHAPNA